MIVILATIMMGLLASVASLLLKKSTAGGINIGILLWSPYFYLGGLLYVFSALLNLYLLKKLPYSIVVPLGSLTYIWTMIIAHKFLGEPITQRKIMGLLLIVVGVGLVVGPW